MASSFQQHSRIRKLVYAGLIVGLLTGSMLFRKMYVEPQAYNLQLRAEATGEVELTGSAVRLTLLGSRGLVTTILWQMAIEKQKRHQWNQLDLLVTSITKVQPNFVTPWLFQSWNLAYNVAVECDQPRDKYFYVSRGTQLLAEGERRHQGSVTGPIQEDEKKQKPKFPGNPEMRFYIGMFYQMKIGTSDEKNAMRCLFDLSCIDPQEWRPERFWQLDADGRMVVAMSEFEDFCRRHPRLVRRLRDKLFCSEPEDVVTYLKNNWGIPSRFDERYVTDNKTKLAERSKQFPILPPPRLEGNLPDPNIERFEHDVDFDLFLASHYWYIYAQEPLPRLILPPPMGVNEPDYNSLEYKIKYRRPKMMLEIFRGYPARSMEYYADNRQKYEGWFDEEGWEIEEWFEDVPGVVSPVVVGRESKYHAVPAWEDAYQEYKDYGEKTGQLLTPELEQKLEQKAKLYRSKYKVGEFQYGINLTGAQRAAYDGKMGESFDAHTQLQWNKQTRSITNFDAHYDLCSVERFSEVVEVRKALYQAKKLKEKFNPQALPEYRIALSRWLDILLKHPRFVGLDEIQAETYENQWKYLELFQDEHKQELTGLIKGMMQFGEVNPLFSQPIPFSSLDLTLAVRQDFEKKLTPMKQVKGPFEQIYVYDGPEGKGLGELFAHLNGAFQVPPKTLIVDPEFVRLRALTKFTAEDPSAFSRDWKPLLRPEAISQARMDLRLEK